MPLRPASARNNADNYPPRSELNRPVVTVDDLRVKSVNPYSETRKRECQRLEACRAYTKPASDRTIGYLRYLISAKDLTTYPLGPIPADLCQCLASHVIKRLRTLPAKRATATTTPTAPIGAAPSVTLAKRYVQPEALDVDTIYVCTADDDRTADAGTFYLVMRAANDSGRLYAETIIPGAELDAQRPASNRFTYHRSILSHLISARRATLSECEAFGRITGRCIVCSRKLTNPESIARGIGPHCALRWNA